MDCRLLIVGDGKSFLINSLMTGLEDTDVKCVFCEPEVRAIEKVKDDAIYLCVSIKRADLLSELNEAQALLMTEEPNYINSLKIRYYSLSISSTNLSAVEKEWLSENDSLIVGYLNDYLPYSDTDSNNKVTGLVGELIWQIGQELIYSDDYKDPKLSVFAVNENNRMQYYYIKSYYLSMMS